MHGNDGGFGLTETLVSLALLAILSLLILQGVGAGRNIWRGVATRAETAESIQAVQAIMRDRIERLFPATRYDTQQPYPDFGGTSSAVTFLAPSAQASGSGILRYTLHMDATGNLVFSSVSEVLGIHPELYKVKPRDEVLLRGIRGIAVSYLDNMAGAGAWRTSWDRRPYLPALVRLRVMFPAGDARWWPALMIHAAATIDSGCVNFNRTGRCGGRL
jgi:general secretion pathway protein J